MNDTVQLLQDVVRNARTGVDAVDQLLDQAEGPGMRAALEASRNQYIQSAREGERALSDAGGEPEPVGAMSKIGMWMGLKAETLMDHSDAHIAEIMIQGANMGVIEMTKSLNTYEYADPQARGIASSFIVRQNETIDRQKPFLGNPKL